jgi:protein TilB
MAPIDLAMIRRRAEHNEGMVSTLEEVSLHQQEIEKIEGLGQICRHLKILYIQNNLISKLANLHRLKELEYGNFAVNNIVKIENLQRCESLAKLDLTVNFVSKASLLTVHTLNANYKLTDLYLMGNPCCDFGGYRAFVVATLRNLKKLDGKDVTPSERISATQKLPEITAQLLKELKRDGVDIDNARKVSDARDLAPDENDIAEILQTPENERRWCPATRVAEQRESAALRDEQVRVGAFQNPPHRPFTCAVWSAVTANVLPPR